MVSLIAFLRECAASGTLLLSLCGLIGVPFFTWLAIRAITPFITRMRDDAPWQAPLSAVASMAPGAMFLSIATIGLRGAASSGCLSFAWGRIFFGTIAVLFVAALIRASYRACRRIAQVRQLVATSHDPDPTLGAMAQRCGVRVRVLNVADAFCALAGIWRPVVLLSQGTLDRLNGQELEAALRHERAHAVRFDLMLAATLSFFADLLPLPGSILVETYAAAREVAADARAVRESPAHALASAIILLARKTTAPQGVAALAEDFSLVKRRVITLLEEGQQKADLRRNRIVASASLGAILSISFLPAVLSALNFYACIVKGMHI